MKKYALIPLAVISLIFLGGCMKKTSDTSNIKDQTQNTETASQTSQDESSFMGSMKDLIGLGKSQKCESAINEENYQGTGTTYISGNRMRTDSNMKMQTGQQIISHMIIDADWIYIWNDGSTTGTKMKVDPEESKAEPTSDASNPADSQADIYKKFDFKCSAWIPDNSMFIVPANIQFNDLSQLMEKIPTGSSTGGNAQMPGSSQNLCQYCENIPDAAAKTDCLKTCSQSMPN